MLQTEHNSDWTKTVALMKDIYGVNWGNISYFSSIYSSFLFLFLFFPPRPALLYNFLTILYQPFEDGTCGNCHSLGPAAGCGKHCCPFPTSYSSLTTPILLSWPLSSPPFSFFFLIHYVQEDAQRQLDALEQLQVDS